MVRSLALPFLTIAAAVTCAGSSHAAEPGQMRLYFWLYGPDDYVPTQYNPGRAGGSSIRLGKSLVACGAKHIEFEHYGFGGEAASVPSSRGDKRLVACVKRRVSFGFNASREVDTAWQRGKRGRPVVA